MGYPEGYLDEGDARLTVVLSRRDVLMHFDGMAFESDRLKTEWARKFEPPTALIESRYGDAISSRQI